MFVVFCFRLVIVILTRHDLLMTTTNASAMNFEFKLFCSFIIFLHEFWMFLGKKFWFSWIAKVVLRYVMTEEGRATNVTWDFSAAALSLLLFRDENRRIDNQHWLWRNEIIRRLIRVIVAIKWSLVIAGKALRRLKPYENCSKIVEIFN